MVAGLDDRKGGAAHAGKRVWRGGRAIAIATRTVRTRRWGKHRPAHIGSLGKREGVNGVREGREVVAVS